MSSEQARTIRLGDREVARIGLGTNRLQHTAEHAALIREIVGAGIQHVDTAHLYTQGASEQAIGDALAGGRDGVVVATKGGYRPGEGKGSVLREQIAQSLASLKVDSIDLYYLHRVDPETPMEESLATIREHVDQGVIRHVGISEVGVDELRRAREIVPITAVQNHYNLAERRHEDVIDACEQEGIVFVPFFPLRDNDGGGELARIAERHGATESQVALAWLLRRSPVMLPIPGTLSLEHARQNLAALELELSDEEFTALQGS
jgi:aryl-alcohol dehydrogenase-like predicted oxidoreductase